MKPTKTFNYCEFCNASHEQVSPPSKEQYESAIITIGEGSSVLLPINIVERNWRKGVADSHATNIQGIYCDYECLIAKIKEILKEDK